jgi:hypothetical protein
MPGADKKGLAMKPEVKKGIDGSGQQPNSHTDENYKGNHIESKPRILPDSGRWTPYVSVNGPREQLRRFSIKRGFATEQDAAQAGLTFAKNWIDDGRPALSKDVVSQF